MICIIALNSVDVVTDIVHQTNGWNRFAVTAVRKTDEARPAPRVQPVRLGRVAAAVSGVRWDLWGRKGR